MSQAEEPSLSLSAISTVNAPFADDVRAYAAAGFDGIGLWDEPLEAVRRVAPRVAGLHVCDWPADPAESGRALPGENGQRTRDIVEALRAGGWAGALDVEIFSTPEGFWGLPVDEAARRAHAAAVALAAS